MSAQLALRNDDPSNRAVSPLRELGAYEALWEDPKSSFKTIAERFRQSPGAVPSDFVSPGRALEYANKALKLFKAAGIHQFGVRVHGAGEYPERLRDAAYPIELLYYQGWWDLVSTPSVAVVGTRQPTPEGAARARRIARALVEDGITVVSGLAAGIDTAAHTSAIEAGGRTVAVIGTPLSECYPKENCDLQARIARNFLLISQIPVCRYAAQNYRGNRLFFPERNITMSALTQATIIIEAGETSGTLVQAKAALNQGRKLFILDSCFRNPAITWPARFAEQGAVRVESYDDVRRGLGIAAH